MHPSRPRRRPEFPEAVRPSARPPDPGSVRFAVQQQVLPLLEAPGLAPGETRPAAIVTGEVQIGGEEFAAGESSAESALAPGLLCWLTHNVAVKGGDGDEVKSKW